MKNVLSSNVLCQQATKPVEIPLKKRRKRTNYWLCPRDWHAERPTSGGDETREAWVGHPVLGKRMWVDPSRIGDGNFVWARVKKKEDGHTDGDKGEVWPEARWHTPNTAIRDTSRRKAKNDIKIFDEGHPVALIPLTEWLNSLKT
jgi:hypothetical protein